MMPMTITANGNAVTTMIDCSPERAVSPPASRSARAAAPSSTPQVTVTHDDGSGLPRWLIEPMTIAAESADVTKNRTIETIASTVSTSPNGRASNTANSLASGPPASLIAWPASSRYMVVPPMMPNQTTHTAAGTTMTTVANSRRVRPREIFAMNMPTNGVHEIHHAQ